MRTLFKTGLLLWVLVVFVMGIAAADGGREDALKHCANPPAPTTQSALITGTFTATRFRVEGHKAKDYTIQCVLKMSRWIPNDERGSKEKDLIPAVLKGKEDELTYVHTFEKVIKESTPLCAYTEKELFEKYWPRPCNVGIQDQFKLQGFPVLTELKILSKSDCQDNELAAIHGSFKIRVVPFKKK
ncbi:MAG: hypothetical protein AB1659_10375 [Thermodesulfobacteriota bacterium]